MITKQEYNILGQSIKMTGDENDSPVAHKAMDLVLKKANEFKSMNPNLKNDELAVIVALTIASDNIKMQNEYAQNLNHLTGCAKEILADISSSCQGVTH